MASAIDKPKDDETVKSPEANTPPEAPKTGNTGNTGNRHPTTDSAPILRGGHEYAGVSDTVSESPP